jgi:hypothetical protein
MFNELPPTERRFAQRFSSRRRSVRLAHYLVCHQLDAWGSHILRILPNQNRKPTCSTYSRPSP